MWRQLRPKMALFLIVLGGMSILPAVIAASEFHSRAWAIAFVAAAAAFAVAAVVVHGTHPVILYLRRFGDTTTRDRFDGWLEKDLANYFRFVGLSDPSTNLVARQGPEFVGCIFAWLLLGIPLFFLQRVLALPIMINVCFALASGALALRFQRHLIPVFARRRTVVMRTDRDVAAVALRAQRWRAFRLSNYLPRRHIEIIDVATELWQQAVLAIAPYAHAILIDISAVGEGLAWELSTLHALYPERLVVVATQFTAPASASDVSARCEIITWAGGSGRTFKRDVRRALWRAVDSSRRRQSPSPR